MGFHINTLEPTFNSAKEVAENWLSSGHNVININRDAKIAGLDAVTLEVDHALKSTKYFLAYIQDGDKVIEIEVSGGVGMAEEDKQSDINRLKSTFESICIFMVQYK